MSDEEQGYEIEAADEVTAKLDSVVRTMDDLIAMNNRLRNRCIDDETGEVRDPVTYDIWRDMCLDASQEWVKREIKKLLKKHPMYDWLKAKKTGAYRAATVLTVIRHPHRFPGMKCSGHKMSGGKTVRHYTLPEFEDGAPCPHRIQIGDDPDNTIPCEGTLRDRRQHPNGGTVTGCRALFHMLGLYPLDDNKLAGHRKGQQSSHNTRAKTACLMPQGIADQMVMQGSPYKRSHYYPEKIRLAVREGLPGDVAASLHPPDGEDYDGERVSKALKAHKDAILTDPTNENIRGLGWFDMTAKIIMCKAWAGDLLMEWKERVPVDFRSQGQFIIRINVNGSTYKVPLHAT